MPEAQQQQAWAGAAWSPEDGRSRFLDAFATVVERHGLSHVRVRDVADELGVSRVTVYRQVGAVPDMTALLFQREIARVLPSASSWLDAADAADALLHALATVARVLRAHPVLDKVIRDEPALLGQYLVRDLPAVLEQSAALGAVMLEDAMRRKKLVRRDARHLSEWIARVLLTAVIAPPAQPLEEFFDLGLRPLLESATPTTTTTRRSKR